MPPAVRVRENQRRSRLRRTELISELQQRIHEHNQRGVQATALVQEAARKVVWENTQLRRLLIERGVSEQEIESCLRTKPGANDGTANVKLPAPQHSQLASATSLIRTGTRRLEERHADTPKSSTHIDVSVKWSQPLVQNDCSEDKDSLWSHRRTEDGIPQKPSIKASPSVIPPDYSMENCTIKDMAQADIQEQGLAVLEPLSDCFCPTLPEPYAPTSEQSDFEMSCEMAASIIIGMHGDGDVDVVRARLGCNLNQDCNVKNVDVMRVLEAG